MLLEIQFQRLNWVKSDTERTKNETFEDRVLWGVMTSVTPPTERTDGGFIVGGSITREWYGVDPWTRVPKPELILKRGPSFDRPIKIRNWDLVFYRLLRVRYLEGNPQCQCLKVQFLYKSWINRVGLWILDLSTTFPSFTEGGVETTCVPTQ